MTDPGSNLHFFLPGCLTFLRFSCLLCEIMGDAPNSHNSCWINDIVPAQCLVMVSSTWECLITLFRYQFPHVLTKMVSEVCLSFESLSLWTFSLSTNIFTSMLQTEDIKGIKHIFWLSRKLWPNGKGKIINTGIEVDKSWQWETVKTMCCSTLRSTVPFYTVTRTSLCHSQWKGGTGSSPNFWLIWDLIRLNGSCIPLTFTAIYHTWLHLPR